LSGTGPPIPCDAPMRLEDFDFALPAELIAQSPARPRDTARLLVLNRATGVLAHRVFRDLPEVLRPADVLVLNDTKVLPARLRARRPTGGQVEVLLLRPAAGAAWETLVRPGRKIRQGARLVFAPGELEGIVGERTAAGTRMIKLEHRGELRAILDRLGEMPTPPYISSRLEDPHDYQTVYARAEGAVAAPTAGLHFTQDLLAEIRRRGIAVAFLTLHVGLGTFRPVRVEDITRHRMDAEAYEIGHQAAALINEARRRGGRIVAVGTTCVRALECAAGEGGMIQARSGSTALFITPGFRFRAVDAMVTNFHLPKSTLLMLASAFAGRERLLDAYAEAIRQRYRFYSFGDAMLIL
jgi:S-adenosylmethionine:tRNA ribosyltransferase-isomerase